MGNKQYQKGVRAEYLARDALKGFGYYVIRSSGSHGIIDLIGFDLNSIILVQVKSGEFPFSEKNKCITDLEAFKRLLPLNCRVELWIKKQNASGFERLTI